MPGHRPELSITQLIAGAAATITATVASSYFGVGGTLIGAGAVSVLSTIGATVYQHFLDRGKARIAAKIPARVGGAALGDDASETAPAETTGAGRRWPRWYLLLGAATGVFLAVMGLVTAFELVTGKPLSNTVRGRSGQGTSVHPVVAPIRHTPTPPAGRRTTAETTATSSAAPPPEQTTPRTTPTPSPSPPTRPDYGRHSAEATAAPPTGRTPTSQTAPDNDDAWRTP